MNTTLLFRRAADPARCHRYIANELRTDEQRKAFFAKMRGGLGAFGRSLSELGRLPTPEESLSKLESDSRGRETLVKTALSLTPVGAGVAIDDMMHADSASNLALASVGAFPFVGRLGDDALRAGRQGLSRLATKADDARVSGRYSPETQARRDALAQELKQDRQRKRWDLHPQTFWQNRTLANAGGPIRPDQRKAMFAKMGGGPGPGGRPAASPAGEAAHDRKPMTTRVDEALRSGKKVYPTPPEDEDIIKIAEQYGYGRSNFGPGWRDTEFGRVIQKRFGATLAAVERLKAAQGAPGTDRRLPIKKIEQPALPAPDPVLRRQASVPVAPQAELYYKLPTPSADQMEKMPVVAPGPSKTEQMPVLLPGKNQMEKMPVAVPGKPGGLVSPGAPATPPVNKVGPITLPGQGAPNKVGPVKITPMPGYSLTPPKGKMYSTVMPPPGSHWEYGPNGDRVAVGPQPDATATGKTRKKV